METKKLNLDELQKIEGGNLWCRFVFWTYMYSDIGSALEGAAFWELNNNSSC